MTKFDIVSLILILLSSCVKETDLSKTRIIRLTNPTDKRLIYYFEANFGSTRKSDTLFAEENQTVDYTFTERVTVKRRFFDFDDIFSGYIIFHEELYNLDDTLSFVFTKNSEVTMTQEESEYMEYTNQHTTRSGKNDVVIVTELVYNDTLSAFLRKDYTMLEKFKDYYHK